MPLIACLFTGDADILWLVGGRCEADTAMIAAALMAGARDALGL